MPTYMGEEEVIKKNMAFAKAKIYTTEDIEALPEDVRAELINGQLFLMATPTPTHQALISFLVFEFYNYIHSHKGTCQVFPAPLALYLNNDNRTYLEPDIMVVCDPEKISGKGCHGAPDFVAEIISPSTQSRDYLLKLNLYQDAGVREYWILDTKRNTIHVYDFVHHTKNTYSFEDTVPVEIFDDLEIDFSSFPVNQCQ